MKIARLRSRSDLAQHIGAHLAQTSLLQVNRIPATKKVDARKGHRIMKNGKESVVRDIMMGSPVTLKPEDTLHLANDVISLGRIRHIPVVDDGKLVGLLSERDLLGAAASALFRLTQKSKSALLKSVLIKDVMKKKVITVKPDTSIKETAHLMKEKKIGCVPVVTDGSLVGLVTTTDILRYVEDLG
jgi:CBS domain-containing protein